MAPKHILFQNATLITFNPSTTSLETLHNHSLLVKDDRITAIAATIEAPQGAEVVNATNKIITPGLINTHTHMWQSAFRSGGPDTSIADYFAQFSQFSSSVRAFTPDDIYVSALEGYLEALNAGTTTMVEHAHANWDVRMLEKDYEAAVSGGARVWWCAAAEEREGVPVGEARGVMKRVMEVNEGKDDALVRLGYAWDGFGGVAEDAEKMREEKEMIRDLKVEAITIHHLGGPWKMGDNSPTLALKSPATLQDLQIPIVFSHLGFATDDEIAAVRKADWNISITPESEYHFGHGQKTSHRALDQASLGIDAAWAFSGDMLTQARMFLQHVRANEYQRVLDEGKAPDAVPMGVEDAFLLLTRQGGLAVRRPDLGVLQVGAKADITIFDTESPNMAGWTNAIAAVVMHANVGDVEGVVVNGEWRKKGGKLVGVDWEEVRARFEKVARRLQPLIAPKPEKREKAMGGAMEWGKSGVFSTVRA